MKLYNTLSKTVEQFTPIHNGEVRIYSCGPTVYNYAHIGNHRAFLFADFLQRAMRIIGGYSVKWVMNITDIDDKTIRDSALNSLEWKAEFGKQTHDPKENLKKLTSFYAQEFLHDISVLGIQKEHFYSIPYATDYIPQMLDLIENIYRNGYAYISNGSIYFNVGLWVSKEKYGKLFAIDFDNVISGSRIDSDEYAKEQASDFVLWKAKKDDEPFWDFTLDNQYLPGRPGWHIECSAMGNHILGLPFDIHTGAVDLRFPHHEDEIAQSKAGYGVDTSTFFCHNEFLEVEGKKMSKSLGNFYTLKDLLDKGLDPLDIRFSLLSTHYASVHNFTFFGIESAKKARIRIQEYIHECFELSGNDSHDIAIIDTFESDLRESIADDLHTPKAIEIVFTFMKSYPAHALSNSQKNKLLAIFDMLNQLFDVWKISPKEKVQIEIPEHILEIGKQRWEAKKNREFQKADELRDILVQHGFMSKDSKDGFELLPL
ncbi:MAG: cysteinyl-tRNA synthetase [Bacteroidota bacterium]